MCFQLILHMLFRGPFQGQEKKTQILLMLVSSLIKSLRIWLILCTYLVMQYVSLCLLVDPSFIIKFDYIKFSGMPSVNKS